MSNLAHIYPSVQNFFAHGSNFLAAARDNDRRERWPDEPFFAAIVAAEACEARGPQSIYRLHIGPGQAVPESTRRTFTTLRQRAGIRLTTEIEFSPSPIDLFPWASGRPRDYDRSAVLWALESCPTIVLAVDWRPAMIEGEAHYRAAPVQAVFRSPLDQAERWEAFLRLRLRPGSRLIVAHSIGGSA